MINQATVAQAVELLLAAAPGGKVILFGSYARGDAEEGSDVDFLVVEPEVLRPLRIPVDVLVTGRRHFEHWADTPGTVYYEAAVEGKLFETLPRAG